MQGSKDARKQASTLGFYSGAHSSKLLTLGSPLSQLFPPSSTICLLAIWQHMHIFFSSATNNTVQVSIVQVDLWPLMQVPQVFSRYCGCETIPACPCFCCTFFAISFLLHFSRGTLAKAAFHLATSTATEAQFVGHGFWILATIQWCRWLLTSVCAFACWVSARRARRAIRSCASWVCTI